MFPSGSQEALLAEVLRSSRRAFTPFPGLQVVERPGWMQLIAPEFKQGGFNEISLAVLDPQEVDRVIDATLETYRRLGLRFRWTVGPDSAPGDLAQRLEARGLRRRWTQAMVRALRPSDDLTGGPEPGGLEVTEALDREGVELFTEVMARGWQVDPAPLRRVHLLGWAESPRRQRLFLAGRNGGPAGVASYIVSDTTAYLLGAVVLPEHRRAGVYRALVHARLADAARRGLRLATSLAMEESSAPLLAKLGFTGVGRLPVYVG